ncbi:MAG: Uma2 family endonuclease [Bacteroidota bacterium]
MITSIDQLDFSKKYTYADYLTWQFDEMVELIHGKIVRISPAPNRRHQEISTNLHGPVWSHLRNQPCQMFHAPFDVRLPLPEAQQTPDKVNTVVQPDLCVICDTTKLDQRGCNGAPDWIIEILSESTAHKDLNEKFDLYEHAGVREYWIVHPNDQTVLVYLPNEQGQYQLRRQKPFSKEEKISVGSFEGFEIDLGEVFESNT